MGSAVMVFVVMIASFVLAYGISVRENRRSSMLLVLFAWTILFPILVLVNEWMPFSGGGDDEIYFHLAGFLRSWSDLASPDQLSGRLAQPGYAIVLNALNLAFSPSLVGFKAFNFLCFLFLVLVWSRSVALLGGIGLARRFAVACVLLTPFWFYFFFLLKDMLIALIMGIFIHGLIMVWKDLRSWSGWVLQLVSVIAFIPLRTPLATQAAVILLIAFMARIVGRGALRHKVSMFALTVLAITLIVWLASSAAVVESFGVESQSPLVGSDEMLERGARMSQESSINRALFPVLYVLSETSGLSLRAWRALDSSWLRGLLALPWIFLVVPLLPSGVLWLISRDSCASRLPRSGFQMPAMRFMVTPWSVIVAFIATSILIAWVTGDTTRWRIADMPALLAVAMAGWQSMPRQKAHLVVVLWILAVATLFVLFALLRGV